MKTIETRVGFPPTGLVLLAIASVQIGSALAKSLFQVLDPSTVVFLRMSLGACILWALWRPRWKQETGQNWPALLGFGVSLAVMNFLFYQAINRIPLGIAVALEFMGPLGLAVIKSRRWLDILWVAFAACGVCLLASIGQTDGLGLDRLGIGFALLAGVCWSIYILVAARVGRILPGIEGLIWALTLGSLLLAPIGLRSMDSALLNVKVFAIATGVALLSTAIPYALELLALKRLPVNVFGVLLSLEPMAAAIAGFWVLGETVTVRAMVAIVFNFDCRWRLRYSNRQVSQVGPGCEPDRLCANRCNLTRCHKQTGQRYRFRATSKKGLCNSPLFDVD